MRWMFVPERRTKNSPSLKSSKVWDLHFIGYYQRHDWAVSLRIDCIQFWLVVRVWLQLALAETPQGPHCGHFIAMTGPGRHPEAKQRSTVQGESQRLPKVIPYASGSSFSRWNNSTSKCRICFDRKEESKIIRRVLADRVCRSRVTAEKAWVRAEVSNMRV